MKLKTKTTQERDVKYFCIDCLPRYWEDADINGEEDISFEEQEDGKSPRMPLTVYSEQEKAWKWTLKIEMDTGMILNWPRGTTADVHYKVCDEGTYWFEDENGNIIRHSLDEDINQYYVPPILDLYGDSYGDYILMNIDENGHIEGWRDHLKKYSSCEKLLGDSFK